MEEIAQTPNGTANFGQTASYTISRNGDLVHKMYFEFDLTGASIDTPTAGDVKIRGCVGHTLLKEVECEIGGQKIDKHYGHWLGTWNQLTDLNPVGKSSSIQTDDGREPSNQATLYQTMSYNHKGFVSGGTTSVSFVDQDKISMVPLQFWFNRNPGLALPLIALQYHEVKIKISFCSISEILNKGGDSSATDPTGDLDGKLWAQYIYLDTDETSLRSGFSRISY